MEVALSDALGSVLSTPDAAGANQPRVKPQAHAQQLRLARLSQAARDETDNRISGGRP